MTTLSHRAQYLLQLLAEVHPEPLTMSALCGYLPIDEQGRFAGLVRELDEAGLIEFPMQGFVRAKGRE